MFRGLVSAAVEHSGQSAKLSADQPNLSPPAVTARSDA
jgi:hypothetical protein